MKNKSHFYSIIITCLFILTTPSYAQVSDSTGQQPENTVEPLNADELSKISAVISASSERPLLDSDLEDLRSGIGSFVQRTGKNLTQNDEDMVLIALNKSTEYEYELGRSLLMSWDNKQVFTTQRFDELYKENQQEGGRKAELLQVDMDRLQCAARNQYYAKNVLGNKINFSREIILAGIKKVEVSRQNIKKIIDVYKEFIKS